MRPQFNNHLYKKHKMIIIRTLKKCRTKGKCLVGLKKCKNLHKYNVFLLHIAIKVLLKNSKTYHFDKVNDCPLAVEDWHCNYHNLQLIVLLDWLDTLQMKP